MKKFRQKNDSQITIWIGSAALLICLLVYGLVYNAASYSFSGVLDYYGFSQPYQKKALQDLFQESTIIGADETLDQAFPLRKTKEGVLPDIVRVLQETQKKFVIRAGSQERWQVQSLEWMDKNKEAALENLRLLGFVDAISPALHNADAFCILGGTAARMADRIAYANSLIESGACPKILLLLAGERYVTKDVDGTQEHLVQSAQKQGLKDWTQLTETHLIQEEYLKSSLSQKNLKVHVIDTPRGDLPRPTTQTTLLELGKWLKDHPQVRSIVFVSNQPYIAYQKAIIHLMLQAQKIDIAFDVAGPAVKNRDNVSALIGALGSYLWAATPAVLAQMKMHLKDPDLKEAFQKLYGQTPLIYKEIPKIFGP